MIKGLRVDSIYFMIKKKTLFGKVFAVASVSCVMNIEQSTSPTTNQHNNKCIKVPLYTHTLSIPGERGKIQWKKWKRSIWIEWNRSEEQANKWLHRWTDSIPATFLLASNCIYTCTGYWLLCGVCLCVFIKLQSYTNRIWLNEQTDSGLMERSVLCHTDF